MDPTIETATTLIRSRNYFSKYDSINIWQLITLYSLDKAQIHTTGNDILPLFLEREYSLNCIHGVLYSIILLTYCYIEPLNYVKSVFTKSRWYINDSVSIRHLVLRMTDLTHQNGPILKSHYKSRYAHTQSRMYSAKNRRSQTLKMSATLFMMPRGDHAEKKITDYHTPVIKTTKLNLLYNLHNQNWLRYWGSKFKQRIWKWCF